jgi:hypothetical protein
MRWYKDMNDLTPEDWSRAEAHLKEVREAYHRQMETLGVQPYLGLDEIASVEARFQKGERTLELYREIMALNF